MKNLGLRYFKCLIVLAILVIMILFCNINVDGKTYYVNLSGNDLNSGTIDNSWETIQYAADIAKAGDVVMVMEGDYRDQERIFLRTSGEENNLITFQAEGVVKTKGFGIFSSVGGPTDYVKIKGFEISETGNDLINGPGIIAQGKGLVIEENNIHDTGKEGVWLFIQYDGNLNPDLSVTSLCIIENNTIFNSNGDGIKIYGENNEILNNKIMNNLGIGISSLNAGSNEIYNNEIYNNDWQGIYLAHSSNSIIEENVVYENCQNYDDCFGVDIIGMGDNNIVRYNKVHSQHNTIIDDLVIARYGGSVKYGTGGIRFDGDYNGDLITSTNSNGNIIHTNLIYDEYMGIQIINFGNSEIYNNNIVNSRQYGLLIMAQPNGGVTKNTIVKNNIIKNSDGYLIYNFGGEESEIDYNIYFDDVSDKFNWNGDIVNFEIWKSNSGLDLNSNFIDPLVEEDMLELDDKSLAIDSGVDVGLSRDIIGTSTPQFEKFDIGAIESKVILEIAPPVIQCGNEIIETGEECDLNNFNGKTCVTQGYDSGNLLCSANCELDLSFCKNDCIVLEEVCDGIDNNCNDRIDENADSSCSVFGSRYRCSSGKCCKTTGRWFWKKTTCKVL